jgi:hypothetical protein
LSKVLNKEEQTVKALLVLNELKKWLAKEAKNDVLIQLKMLEKEYELDYNVNSVKLD